jgi:DNA-binding response OmpR family regulator
MQVRTKGLCYRLYTSLRIVRDSSDIPILFMTSKKTPQDIVAGLNLGGDDYITKPFEPEVLVARLQAGLRRYRAAVRKAVSRNVWEDGWLTVRMDQFEVRVANTPLALPAKEMQLLLHLLEHRKQVFSVRQLYERRLQVRRLTLFYFSVVAARRYYDEDIAIPYGAELCM